MLSEIFYWVFNMSIIGSVVGVIILALRKVKGLPVFITYALWVIPLFRLWIPFGVANKYSLLNLLSQLTTKTIVIRSVKPELTMTNSIMAADSYFPIGYKTDMLAKIFDFASVIWIIIATAAILSAALLYKYTKSELKNIEHIRDNIYTSEKITSPAVYGVIRPKIIIPAVMTDKDMDYVILHEQVHVKRKDNLFRLIAVITSCVHWFNPLSWLFLKYFFEDMEITCDLKVLKHLNKQQANGYANAILSCASGKAFFSSQFGGAKVRVRIENILSYKKLTLFSSFIFGVFAVALAVVLITNAAG